MRLVVGDAHHLGGVIAEVQADGVREEVGVAVEAARVELLAVPAEGDDVDVGGVDPGLLEAEPGGAQGLAVEGVAAAVAAFLFGEGDDLAVAVDETGGGVVPAGRRRVDAQNPHGAGPFLGWSSVSGAFGERERGEGVPHRLLGAVQGGGAGVGALAGGDERGEAGHDAARRQP